MQSNQITSNLSDGETQTPSYYAVIPASIRYDKQLPANAKLLYGEITALCNQEGYCWANNNYFANLYNVDKDTVSKWISKLTKLGHLILKIIYFPGTKQVKQRRLYIADLPIKKSIPHDEITDTPPDEMIEDNIKDINSKFNIKEESNTHTHHAHEEKKSDSSEVQQKAAEGASSPAQIFQLVFDLSLDKNTIDHINKSIPASEILQWDKMVRDRWAGLTPEKKKNETYRAKALEYLLEDFPKKQEKIKQENFIASQATALQQEKLSSNRQGYATPAKKIYNENSTEPPRKDFRGLVENRLGLPGFDYEKFRDGLLQNAIEKGNERRIKEIEDYDRERSTRRELESRKNC